MRLKFRKDPDVLVGELEIFALALVWLFSECPSTGGSFGTDRGTCT